MTHLLIFIITTTMLKRDCKTIINMATLLYTLPTQCIKCSDWMLGIMRTKLCLQLHRTQRFGVTSENSLLVNYRSIRLEAL